MIGDLIKISMRNQHSTIKVVNLSVHDMYIYNIITLYMCLVVPF